MLELAHSWPRSEGEYVYALNSCIVNTMSWRKARVCSIRCSTGSESTHNPNDYGMVTYNTFDLLYQQINLKVHHSTLLIVLIAEQLGNQ